MCVKMALFRHMVFCLIVFVWFPVMMLVKNSVDVMISTQNVLVLYSFVLLKALIGYVSILLVRNRMALNLCWTGWHESMGMMWFVTVC
jgi:hypothetical protein